MADQRRLQATAQPHIVLKVYGDAGPDFALVPITESLGQTVVEHVDGLGSLDRFVEAEFHHGAPVFFEMPESCGLEGLLRQVTDEGYEITTGRPDVPWRHFKRTKHTRIVVQRDSSGWNVCWRTRCDSAQLQTFSLSATVIVARCTPHLSSGSIPFTTLDDGSTPLYPAYYPLRSGERFCRRMDWWNGATGEWFGVTLDGRLFRQRQLWGNDVPDPDRWQPFRLGGA